ncbi:TIGR03086 family metal-binding protein [Nocardia sp. NPDC020380]|uniref:TIGR03086 family metal-binding protein n=1 Tax=Nocardia sp. NPDC020380 TaxID=3364309 RepID=UPI0037BD3F96
MVRADRMELAIGFAFGKLAAVSGAHLTRGTPCGDWDLAMLLHHLADSVDAVCDGIEQGRIAVYPDLPPPDHPVERVRKGLCRLLDAWLGVRCNAITIGELPLPAREFADIAALELTVHAWDIGSACADPRPIPASLAAELLSFARFAVPAVGRDPIFGPEVPVPDTASASDRLVAFLGRDPAVRQCFSARR